MPPLPPHSIDLSGFDALVLQGGGARCFFTLGFLEVVGPALTGITEIATVSASSAMACAHLVGGHHEALEEFAGRVRRNPRNFYPERLLRMQSPIPHHGMYRDAMHAIVDRARFAHIKSHAQQLRILVSLGPGRSRAVVTALGALAVLRKKPAPLLRPHVIVARDLSHPDELVGAVLASSAFPPFTPIPMLHPLPDGQGPDGKKARALIDGGAVAPVPLCALSSARRPLVLLTRPIEELRISLPPGLAFACPPLPLEISTWQYADEAALRRVYATGRRAGERFLVTGPSYAGA